MNRTLLYSLLIGATLLGANEPQTPAKIAEDMLKQMLSVVNNEDTNTTQQTTPSPQATTQTPFDYHLQPTQVSENVWCFLGKLEGPSKENAGAMSNSCWIKTDDSYVLLDSGPSYQYAKQSYEAMKKIADLPVSTVFISHDHDDHWLGNNFYKEEFNATLIGPKMVNTNYQAGDKTRMFQKLPQNAIEGTKIVKLDQTPMEELNLTIGGEKFEFIPVHKKAHTPEDYFLYMPERQILFTGDLAMNGRITSNRDGSLMGQLQAIKMIRAKQWKNLVAGHGFITDETALDEAEQYFTLMYEQITKALEEEMELTDIDPIEMMKPFQDKAMFDALNTQNVNEAFTELEFLEE